MARFLASIVASAAVLVGLAAPAAAADAAPSVPIIVGFPDGSFTTDAVRASQVATTLDRLDDVPGVAYAEVDAPMHAASATAPNDPAYSQQWGPQKVGAPEAWARTTGRTSVVVAVVDTGVDGSVPDLAGSVLAQRDFVGDGRSGDPNGHGTGVAGVIAGRGDNGVGIAGYCWNCTILPVRALDADGNGTVSGVASGIRYAADNGARIINLSLAGDTTTITLDQAIAYARSKGVVVIAAAGNQTAAGQNLSSPQYPAASPGVIGVVATTPADTIYDWSHRGTWADLAAPGCVTTTAPGGGYQGECGTSFAAPAVAGVLALAMSASPSVSGATLANDILAHTAPIAAGLAAHGRLDAASEFESIVTTYGVARTADRVAGSDRIATAIALSQRLHRSATDVVIARSDAYADALAAAPLAEKLGAPVLLSPSGGVTGELADEVRRLGATRAWLIGGESALTPAVEAGVRAAGVEDVRRLAGPSRYATARLIAAQVGGTTAYAVNASSWADAVAASAVAAQTGAPILLVDRYNVPADTSAALPGITKVTVVGGSGVIADSVLTLLRAAGVSADRVAGANRYETSRALADIAVAAGADAARSWVATGNDWPDALAAGPAAAADGGVLRLVDGRNPGLAQVVPGQVVIVGGVSSVTQAVVDALLG